MQSVILLTMLMGLGSQILHIPNGPGLSPALALCSALTLLAILLYGGQRRLRIISGLFFITSAAAFMFVGLTRVPRGSAAACFSYVASLGFLYCCWVILGSRHGRRFLEAREQWLRSRRLG